MKTCPKCGEILGDSVNVCFNCKYDFDLKRVLDGSEVTQKRLDAENKIKEQMELTEAKRLAHEKELERIQLELENQLQRNPRYEYKSIVIDDDKNGAIDNSILQRTLTNYAENGWRLHSVFTNEVFLGNISGTRDQTILIFERCIKAEG